MEVSSSSGHCAYVRAISQQSTLLKYIISVWAGRRSQLRVGLPPSVASGESERGISVVDSKVTVFLRGGICGVRLNAGAHSEHGAGVSDAE